MNTPTLARIHVQLLRTKNLVSLIALIAGSALEATAQTSWSGTISDTGGPVALSGTYKLVGDTTLTGTSSFTMTGDPSVPSGVIIGTDGNGRNLFNQTTVTGSGLFGAATGVSSNLNVNNSGTFNANLSGGTLEFAQTSGFTNSGLMEATGGGILFLATSTPLNNSGGTLTASGSGSTINVSTSIQGGTLTSASGGLIETVTHATLDGSTNGAITLSNGSTYTAGAASTTNNTTDVIGTLNLGTTGSASLSVGGLLRLVGNETLSGPGTMTMNGGQIGTDGNARLLTNGSIIQGYGVIGTAATATGSNPSISSSLQLSNSGTVDANSSGNTLTVGGSNGAMTNTGLFEATGGGILLLDPSGGAINNNTGTITASGSGSTVNVNATIEGGTLTTASGGVMQTSGGSAFLDGSSSGAITLSNGTTYTAGGTSTTNNTTDVQGSLILGTSGSGANLSVGGLLRLRGTETLSGPGTLTLVGGQIGTDGNGRNLANGSTIQGYGVIGVNVSATGSNPSISSSVQMNNTGTINANNAGGLSLTLSETNGTLNNSGLMEATGGGELIVAPSGGNGVNNSGGTITSSGTGSLVEISNTTIQGGTLTTSGGGTMQTVGTSTLDGVNEGTLTLSNGSTYAMPTATTTQVTGTIDLGTSGSGSTMTLNGSLRLVGSATLAGPGNLTMSGGAIGTDGNGRTLTNQATIQGTGTIGSSVSPLASNLVLTNSGTIDANIAAGTLTISPTGGAVNNTGTLEATNGGILALSPSNPVNNGGGTILASGSGSTVQINADIQGGTLTTTGGGLMETNGTATLDGSTSNGAVVLTDGSVYTAPTATTTTVLGSLTLGTTTGSTLDLNGLLRLLGTETIAPPGAVVMAGGAIGTDGNGRTLINQAVISGYGAIGASVSGSPNISSNLNVSNSGTIDANSTGNTLTMGSSAGVTNTGLLEATNGGTLALSITSAALNNNGGNITASGTGSTVQVSTDVQGGTLNTSSGGVVESIGSNQATLDGTSNGAITISNGSTYTAATGTETLVIGTLNLGTSGSGGNLALGGNLRLVGTETFGGTGTVTMNNGQIGTDGNGRNLVNNATIQGSGLIGSSAAGISNNLNTANNGTILANASGATLQIGGTDGASNSGTFQVNPGSTLLVTSSLSNVSGATLSGGAYIVNGASPTSIGEMQINSFGNNVLGEITTDSANITLNGPNLDTLLVDAGGHNALTPLASVTTGAGLTLEGGYVFQTLDGFSNAGAVTLGGSAGSVGTLDVGVLNSTYTQTGGTTQINSGGTLSTGASGTVHIAAGTVTMAGGNMTTNVLTNDSTGTLVGNGTVGGLGVGSATNQGLVEANGGALTFNANVQGTSGTLQVNPGATLTLANGLAGGTAPSTTGTLTQSGTLNIGANNVTVSTIYTNPNFGVGNNFNNHADVQGTGQLLAAGNAALTVTGSAVSGPTATPTLTLPNYHTGSSASATYAINNVGTTGPSVTGAIQTGAPGGGNITASNLSGTGVTASNFAQLADGQSTSAYTVTVGGNTAGPLAAGQTIHVASNFDNVAGPTVSLAGGTGYNLAQANTLPTPVALGNVHVNGTLGTNLSISNMAPSGAYTEGLAVGVTGTSGGASTTGTISTPLVAGASPNTAIAVNLNTGTAGPLSGSATLGFTSVAVTGSGLSNTPLSAQTVNVTGTAYNLAAATLGTINIGSVLQGSVVNPTLLVTNSGPSGGFTEGLDATVAGYSGGTAGSLLTSTNHLTTILQGASSNLTFSLNTSAAGTLSGNVLVGLNSDGGGAGGAPGAVVTSGLGITGLAQQSAATSGTIMVTGVVGVLASPGPATPNPVTLNARLNAALPTQALSITNLVAGSPEEGLDASISPTTGAITATGSFGLGQATTSLAAGSTNNTTLVVGLASTATAGAANGTATITLASDGSLNGSNSNAPTTLTPQTITVNGAVYQPAVASTLPTNVALGNVRIGGTLSQALSIGNAAPGTGGYTETLGASFSGTTGSSTSAVGGPILVASGTGPSTAMSVGLTTGTAGALSGSATVAFTTNAINSSGLGQASVGSQTVNLSGAVYQPAVGATSLTTGGTPLPTTVAIGTVRTGTVVNTGLTVSNAAPTTAGPTYTETLGASFASGASAGLTPTGSASGLIAGGASSTALSVSYTAGAPGAYTGSATVNYVTQAVNGSGLGTMGVGSSTVGFTSTVNALANGVVQTVSGGYSFTPGTNSGTLNFGTVTLGVGSDQENLDLLNIVAGGVPADMLTGNFVTTALAGSPFGFGGGTSIGDLTANGSGDPFDITFNTNAGTGLFSETVTIDEASHNSSQSDLNLTPYTLTIDGTINPVGTPTVPDSGTTALFLGLGLLGLALAGRRFRRMA